MKTRKLKKGDKVRNTVSGSTGIIVGFCDKGRQALVLFEGKSSDLSITLTNLVLIEASK